MGKNQHVTKNSNGGWNVLGAGNTKPSHVLPTKKDAINVAIGIAKNQKSEMIIHGVDGKIQGSNSYGTDPFPPRG